MSITSGLKKLESSAKAVTQKVASDAKNVVKTAKSTVAKAEGQVKKDLTQVTKRAQRAAQRIQNTVQKVAKDAKDGFETLDQNIDSIPQTIHDLQNPYGDPKLLPPKNIGLNTTNAQLDRQLDQHTGSRATEGNRVSVQVDGEHALPKILQNIDSAKKSICYETYEFDKNGTSVDAVVSHLIAAHKRGVDVRVTADAVGGRELMGSNPELDRLRKAGIPVQTYNPIDSLQDIDVHRDHRKSMVFDGQTAIVGGMNTGDRYLGGPNVAGRFHDVNTVIQGPAVNDVLKNFLDTWKSESGKVVDPKSLMGPKPAPITDAQTGVKMRVIEHTPGKDANIRAAYLALINHSTKNINIQNGYPMSDDIANALVAASKRGVKVNYIYGSDMGALGIEARQQFDKLMKAGVHVFIYPTPIHTKSLSVDGQFATVGSSNVDQVALNRNREIITLAEDPKYTQNWDQQLFAKDMVGSPDGKKSIELKYPLQESFFQKLEDHVLKGLWPESYV